MSWREQAACIGVDTNRFYPTSLQVRTNRRPTSTRVLDRIEQAKRICAGCPVRAECLDEALETREPDGVWGGLAAHERWRVSPQGVHGVR